MNDHSQFLKQTVQKCIMNDIVNEKRVIRLWTSALPFEPDDLLVNIAVNDSNLILVLTELFISMIECNFIQLNNEDEISSGGYLL